MSNGNYWHNIAEQARSDGKPYDPPHGIFEELTTWTDSGMRRITEDNTQYRKGWDNAEQ